MIGSGTAGLEPADFAELAVAVVTILGAAAAGLRWMVKHYLWELRPNHGSSMSDRLARVEANMGTMQNQISQIFDHLLGGNHG